MGTEGKEEHKELPRRRSRLLPSRPQDESLELRWALWIRIENWLCKDSIQVDLKVETVVDAATCRTAETDRNRLEEKENALDELLNGEPMDDLEQPAKNQLKMANLQDLLDNMASTLMVYDSEETYQKRVKLCTRVYQTVSDTLSHSGLADDDQVHKVKAALRNHIELLIDKFKPRKDDQSPESMILILARHKIDRPVVGALASSLVFRAALREYVSNLVSSIIFRTGISYGAAPGSSRSSSSWSFWCSSFSTGFGRGPSPRNAAGPTISAAGFSC